MRRAIICSGIYLHQRGDALAGVATDGHQLSVYSIALPPLADGLAGVIIGRKTVGELLRVLPGDGEVSLTVSPSRITMNCAELRIVSKLVDGKYPDYQRVIPPLERHRVIVGRKLLAETVERVTPVLEAKVRALTIEIGAGSLRLSVANQSRGKAVAEIDALAEGPACKIGVNCGYLADILGALTADRVVIGYEDGKAPLRIWNEGDDEGRHITVLMPMHV